LIQHHIVQHLVARAAQPGFEAARMSATALDEFRHTAASKGAQGDHGWTSQAMALALQHQGIAVTASEAFAVDGEPAPAAVRISLSSTPNLVDLRFGLEVVAQLAGAPQEPVAVRL
jgi:hypothetical protein